MILKCLQHMPKKILIVDDDEAVLQLLNTRLISVGYETVMASDGEEGLKKARKELPDLILLDVMMPNLDGYQFSLLLKADERFKKTPIIMLTSLSQHMDAITGRALGAVEYVTKPFDSVKLLETINKWLTKK